MQFFHFRHCGGFNKLFMYRVWNMFAEAPTYSSGMNFRGITIMDFQVL